MSNKDNTVSSPERVVQLHAPAPFSALEFICSEAQISCVTQTQYQDIIYIPMMRKFWIIPKRVAEELDEAAVTLFNNGNRVAKSSPDDKIALMEALDLSHVMKFFYSPHPSTFLNEDDYAEYQELKQLNEEACQQIEEKRYHGGPPAGTKADLRYPGRTYPFVRYATQRELDKFNKAGKKAAEASGYQIDETGEIFTPEQIKLRDLLLKYTENAQVIAQNEKLTGEMRSAFDELERLQSQFQYYQKSKQDYEKQAPNYATHEAITGLESLISFYEGRYQSLSKTLQEQIAIILELSTIGIAVPELALGHHNERNNNATNRQDRDLVKSGIDSVYLIHRKQQEKNELINHLSSLFSDWQFFLGNIGASVPSGPFEETLLELITLDNALQQYIEDAEESCNRFIPRKILVWDPTNYQYKSNDALLNAPMPLREFTKPSLIKKIDRTTHTQFKELYQFSIKDLAEKSRAANFAKKSSDYFNLLSDLKSHFKRLNDNHDELLDIYLKESGAVEIKLEKTWFGEDKLFDPDKFFASIQNYHILSLQKDEDKKAWGELLKYLIFEEDFLKRVMGFDPGYGAQLVRLLSKYTKDYVPFMKYAADVSGKAPSLANFSLGGAEARLVASPYHGKVVSDPFYLPKPANAINPVFTFKHHATRQPIEIDFGYFIFKLTLEARGFAGASLALSADVSLYAEQGQFGVTVSGPAELLSPLQQGLSQPAPAKGINVGVGGELFVGVQSGIGGTVECKWCPPKGTHGHFWLNLEKTLRQLQNDNRPPANVNAKLDHTIETHYKTLGRFSLGRANMAGLGVNAAFGLTVTGNKIRIRIAAGRTAGAGAKISVEFDIDPSEAVDIVRLVLQAIRKNDNRPIGWCNADAFEKAWQDSANSYDDEGQLVISESFYNWMTKLMLIGRAWTSMAFAFTVDISRLETLYKTLTADFGLLAAHLANTVDYEKELIAWFNELHPQAIGALLYNLSKDMAGNNSYSRYLKLEDSTRYTTGELIANQQQAIANCVDWLLKRNGPDERDDQTYPNTAQIIFGEAVLRMNDEGINADLDRYYHSVNGDKSQAWAQDVDSKNYWDNIKRIEETMKRTVTTSNSGLNGQKLKDLQKISNEAKTKFNKEFPGLTKHIHVHLLSVMDFITTLEQRSSALNQAGGHDAQSV